MGFSLSSTSPHIWVWKRTSKLAKWAIPSTPYRPSHFSGEIYSMTNLVASRMDLVVITHLSKADNSNGSNLTKLVLRRTGGTYVPIHSLNRFLVSSGCFVNCPIPTSPDRSWISTPKVSLAHLIIGPHSSFCICNNRPRACPTGAKNKIASVSNQLANSSITSDLICFGVSGVSWSIARHTRLVSGRVCCLTEPVVTTFHSAAMRRARMPRREGRRMFVPRGVRRGRESSVTV